MYVIQIHIYADEKCSLYTLVPEFGIVISVPTHAFMLMEYKCMWGEKGNRQLKASSSKPTP